MDGMLVNGQRPFSRKITNFMRAAQRLRGDSSRRRAFFALGVALLRGIRCSGGAVAAHVPRALPKVGSRLRERPPARHTVGALPEKMGDFSAKTRENRRKVPAFFRKAPNGRRAVGRTRFAPSRFVAIGREPCVRKRGPRPPVCLCRRLRCGEIAVIRRGKSESPLVRFDAKV